MRAEWGRYNRTSRQPAAVDYLLEHLDEGSSAAKALFESGSPKALPALEKYLARLKKMKQPDELDLAVATDDKDRYYHCHDDLRRALNRRLNTSFRTMTPLVEYLQRKRAAKAK